VPNDRVVICSIEDQSMLEDDGDVVPRIEPGFITGLEQARRQTHFDGATCNLKRSALTRRVSSILKWTLLII
jgi:hypothetical protein